MWHWFCITESLVHSLLYVPQSITRVYLTWNSTVLFYQPPLVKSSFTQSPLVQSSSTQPLPVQSSSTQPPPVQSSSSTVLLYTASSSTVLLYTASLTIWSLHKLLEAGTIFFTFLSPFLYDVQCSPFSQCVFVKLNTQKAVPEESLTVSSITLRKRKEDSQDFIR